MRHIILVTGLIGAFALVGCNKSKKNDMFSMGSSDEFAESEQVISPAPEPMPEPTAFGEVQPTESMASLPAHAASPRTYVIQPRDTLWSIARRYYGHGNRWHEIADVNPGIVPERLRIGQTISLP